MAAQLFEFPTLLALYYHLVLASSLPLDYTHVSLHFSKVFDIQSINMPRIRNDPNFNVCPDYASDIFANSRAQLVNDNTTEVQEIQLLKDIWEANNNSDKIV
jgi:hypothetical protein